MKMTFALCAFLLSLEAPAEDLEFVAERTLRNSFKENNFAGENMSAIGEDGLSIWSFRMEIPRWALDPVYSAFLKPDSDRIFVYVVSSNLNELERYHASPLQHIEFRVVMKEHLYRYTSKEGCTRWIDQEWEVSSHLYPSLRFDFVAGPRLAQVWLEEDMGLSRCEKLKDAFGAQ